MNPERLMQVLVEPKISEKSSRIADLHRQFVFRVLGDASKPEIKAAVELLFKVEVEEVTTANVRAKRRQFRNRTGFRAGWKKAYVKLKEGFDINFDSGELG
jgi:large subunit ribosomal protein L23